MIPRRERLPRAAFGKGPFKRVSSEHFAITVPRDGRGYAIVVSKKVARRAVDRHRLKRLVWGALVRPPAVSLPPSLILYPRARAALLSPAEFRSELSTLLETARRTVG